MKLKWLLIIILVSLISYLHIFAPGHSLTLHILHQQLFFVPIILASFWFGLPSGIAVSVLVSVIFSTVMFSGEIKGIRLAINIQVAIYIGIAFLIGWLRKTLQRQQEKILKDERNSSLNKLVSSLSFEIQEIINNIQIKYDKYYKNDNRDVGGEFKQEIDRLSRITNSFSRIVPLKDQSNISYDLNQIVKLALAGNKHKAEMSDVQIQIDTDASGCPSMVFTEEMIDIFNALIANAIEASPKGSTILLRAKRAGLYCSLEVIDSGPGVLKENMSKLFNPFFTTKENGFGLGLSSGRKVMRAHEGDLLYEPKDGGGAIFRMIVPRENRDCNIDTYVSEKTKSL